MKKIAIGLIFTLFGCGKAPDRFDVQFQRGAIHISGIDPAFLAGIKSDTTTAIWQKALPVYRMPADTEMKDYQQPQPGKYQLSGDEVIFRPDTPFRHNQTYFVRYYHFGEGKSIWDAVKGKNNIRNAAYSEKILKAGIEVATPE